MIFAEMCRKKIEAMKESESTSTMKGSLWHVKQTRDQRDCIIRGNDRARQKRDKNNGIDVRKMQD